MAPKKETSKINRRAQIIKVRVPRVLTRENFVKKESGEDMELRMSRCVRGYHGYQREREAVVGEI